MFDIGALEFLVLGIAALFVFGPDRLPDMARKAARGLRTIQAMAANARRDFTKELGPEFEDLDMRDLNPRSFVRKHLLNDVEQDLDLKDELNVDLGDKPGARSRRRNRTGVNGTSSKTAERTQKARTGGGSDPADDTASAGVDTVDADTMDAADASENDVAVPASSNGAATAEASTEAVADHVVAGDLGDDTGDGAGADAEAGSALTATALLVRQEAPPFDLEAT